MKMMTKGNFFKEFILVMFYETRHCYYCCSIEGDAISGSSSSSPAPLESSSRSLSRDQISRPSSKKKKLSKDSEVDDAILQSLKDISARRSDHVPDEEELFSGSVAAVLRRLQPHQKAVARLRIQQVLIDIEFPEPANNTMHSASFSGYAGHY